MNETARIFSLQGVRYQVADVGRAAAFYTDHLGFKLEHQQLPAVGERVARRLQAAPQRGRRIGISSADRRRIPEAGRAGVIKMNADTKSA